MKKIKHFLFDVYCMWENPFVQIIVIIVTVILTTLLVNGNLYR